MNHYIKTDRLISYRIAGRKGEHYKFLHASVFPDLILQTATVMKDHYEEFIVEKQDHSGIYRIEMKELIQIVKDHCQPTPN